MSHRQSAATGPDYVGLVRLLSTLHHLPDADGRSMLEPQEAEHIRRLGFQAQPGPWVCPLIPAHLVAGNVLLEHLTDNVDPFWYSKRAALRVEQPPVEPVHAAYNGDVLENGPEDEVAAPPSEPSERDCNAILEAVERSGGQIERRQLQKKLWRIRAEQFNRALDFLVEQALIQIQGNSLIAQRADGTEQPGLPPFHAVPPPQESVPQAGSALGLTGELDQVNEFRGDASRKIEYPELPCNNNAMQRK